MSGKEVALQVDMFSGELIDARSDSQKKKDKERNIPQQTQMFKTPEMVQFGGKTRSAYRDWLDQSTAPPLVLQLLDTRTAEEIERDLILEAEKLTTPMFSEVSPPTVEDQVPLQDNPVSQPQPTVIFDAKQHRCQRGLRARLRAQSVPVRRRC